LATIPGVGVLFFSLTPSSWCSQGPILRPEPTQIMNQSMTVWKECVASMRNTWKGEILTHPPSLMTYPSCLILLIR